MILFSRTFFLDIFIPLIDTSAAIFVVLRDFLMTFEPEEVSAGASMILLLLRLTLIYRFRKECFRFFVH